MNILYLASFCVDFKDAVLDFEIACARLRGRNRILRYKNKPYAPYQYVGTYLANKQAPTYLAYDLIFTLRFAFIVAVIIAVALVWRVSGAVAYFATAFVKFDAFIFAFVFVAHHILRFRADCRKKRKQRHSLLARICSILNLVQNVGFGTDNYF